MSQLQRNVLKSKLPPLPDQFSTSTHSRFAGLVPKHKRKSYTPVEWNEYFENCHDVRVGENSFRVYSIGNTGPVLLLLHGGGHSALSWAVFANAISKLCECQTIAIDFRGHGGTVTTDDGSMDAHVLARSGVSVIFTEDFKVTQVNCQMVLCNRRDMADVLKTFIPDDLPPVVILGHSMGGAIAVHIGVQELIPTLRGVAVIDVVEGTALDALSSMGNFIRSRPESFASLEGAVEWSVRSGQLKNLESARVSMPGQLKRVATEKVDKSQEDRVTTDDLSEIKEEGEDESLIKETKWRDRSYYTWRVDLLKTEPYWKGWFQDMSSLFLSCRVPKLLILAGVDRLDKTLTIGQMQGKFQMQVLANCGHMVHEDKPDAVAEIIMGFLVRQKLTEAKPGVKRHMPAC